MSVEENKELARRFEEELHNQKKFEVIDEIIAPEYINNGPDNSHTFTREGLKDLFRARAKAVPDFHDEIHQIVAEGDLVVIRSTRSGTFTEEYGNLEPTGNYASFSIFMMLRIEDGKLAECWYLADTVALEKWTGTYGKE